MGRIQDRLFHFFCRNVLLALLAFLGVIPSSWAQTPLPLRFSPMDVAFTNSHLPRTKPITDSDYRSRITKAIEFIEADLARQDQESEKIAKMTSSEVIEQLGSRIPQRLRHLPKNEFLADLDMARTLFEALDNNGKIRASGCRMRALYLAELLKRSGIPASSINIVETVNEHDLLTMCPRGEGSESTTPSMNFSGHTFISVQLPNGTRRLFNPTGGNYENNNFKGFALNSEGTGWQIPPTANPYTARIGNIFVFRNLSYSQSTSYFYRERAGLIQKSDLKAACATARPTAPSLQSLSHRQ